MTSEIATHAETAHLDALTDEAITIIREVATECMNPVLLFSGGKDSAVLLHLAVLAFAPARLPFPVMHVDTGHNFDEVIAYRDDIVQQWGVRLVVASVQESIDAGRVVEDTGPRASRNRLQSVTLLDAIGEHGFNALLKVQNVSGCSFACFHAGLVVGIHIHQFAVQAHGPLKQGDQGSQAAGMAQAAMDIGGGATGGDADEHIGGAEAPGFEIGLAGLLKVF